MGVHSPQLGYVALRRNEPDPSKHLFATAEIDSKIDLREFDGQPKRRSDNRVPSLMDGGVRAGL